MVHDPLTYIVVGADPAAGDARRAAGCSAKACWPGLRFRGYWAPLCGLFKLLYTGR